MTPRDESRARARLLADCQRPAFAALARYTRELDDGSGDTVTRASVKFVEAALARWGNVRTQTAIVADSEDRRTVSVILVDLETGAEYSQEVQVDRIVERRTVGKRDPVRGTKRTPSGLMFLVPASDEDLAAREARLVSIAIRQLGLRLLPADLVAEGMAVVAATLDAAAPTIPTAAAPPPTPPGAGRAEISRAAGLAASLRRDRHTPRPITRPAARRAQQGARTAERTDA